MKKIYWIGIIVLVGVAAAYAGMKYSQKQFVPATGADGKTTQINGKDAFVKA